ncbi:MAG: NAD(P)-dependent oxidoreductase [Candidatus Pelagibacter sp. TMED165]|nr:MAG: NAD(P)-dependent oxidoreductase [Candidatus Pelagibacter sp. TMED165]
MKILITGSCGHIGSYIVSNIHKIRGIKELILVDNLSSSQPYSLNNINKKIKNNFYLLDVSKLGSLRKFKKVDVIIHCASFTNAQSSFEQKNNMYKNNLNCMRNVINYCKKNKTKLIHISSTSIYGRNASLIREGDKAFIKPISPYARIKLIEEKMLSENNNKLNYITFRLGTIAGVSKGIRFHTAINKFCFQAALNQKIEVYRTALNQYRPYLSLKDAFKVFKFCLEKNYFKNIPINVLSGNFTVKDIIKKISKYKNNIKIRYIDVKIMNKINYMIDNSKLNSLGIKIHSNLEKEIKETLSLLK